MTLVVIDVHKMVLRIISITPGALVHDTNVRMGGGGGGGADTQRFGRLK